MRINKKVILISILVAILILDIATVCILDRDYEFFENDYSSVILDRNGKILRVFLNSKEQWKIDKDDEVPEKLIKSVICFEDKRYYKHHGVDYKALVRAVIQNIIKRRKFSGASTLTMQVARLSEPKKRTIPNKIKEIFVAYILEYKFTKNEILKMYFNNAPYGSNIVGYQAASLRYFGKEARDLSWAESATLAVLPNSPGLISPLYGKEKLLAKRNRLLKKMYEKSAISEETYQLSLLEKVPNEVFSFPLSAPHFARYIEKQNRGKTVMTTIDENIQYDVNKIIKSYINLLKIQNVRNVSAIITDTKTGEVIAYIGSQDFFDDKNAGKINGVKTNRSTGSLLKPFLYGLAIDRGMISSETMLEDVPKYFGTYSPQNYNRDYKGLVSVKDALTSSLNIPAVDMLDKYGVYAFYTFLKENGITTLKNSAKYYGLPLILGGSEGRLDELVNLYRLLGNEGRYTKLKYLIDGETEEKEVLEEEKAISTGASYLVLNMLKDVKRPGTDYYSSYFSNKWPLAWKTGTSFGGRDAWAIGVSPKWTIGVWTGNFSGMQGNNISGVKTAAPILFDIFNYLPKDNFSPWFTKPINDLKKETVYRDTGYRVLTQDLTYDKTFIMKVDMPKEAPSLKQDIYRKKIFLSSDEKEQVCSLCWESGEYIEKIEAIYPPDVSEYLLRSGRAQNTLPHHRENCPSLNHQVELEFIYPKAGSHILIPKDFNGEYQKIRVSVGINVNETTLYWYLNGKYLGKTENKHEYFIEFSSGNQELTVQEQSGIKKSIRFYTDKR